MRNVVIVIQNITLDTAMISLYEIFLLCTHTLQSIYQVYMMGGEGIKLHYTLKK